MVEWRVYGCGSASSNRFLQSSYEIIDDDTRIQIDFGNGAMYQRCRAEGGIIKALDSITHMVFTHSHPDHTVDLTRHVVAWKYTPGYSPGKPVHLYGTQPTINNIQDMLNHIGLENMFDDVFIPHVIENNTPFTIGSISVTPLPADHMAGSIGLQFVTRTDMRIAFTGDTGYYDGIEKHFQNLDLMVVESSFFDYKHHMHLNLEQCSAIFKNANPSAVILVHLYPEMETRPHDEIQDFVKPMYDGPVHPAEDGMQYQWDENARMWVIHRLF
jgi:ribonuclease BN (tRNA processing enzyme)